MKPWWQVSSVLLLKLGNVGESFFSNVRTSLTVWVLPRLEHRCRASTMCHENGTLRERSKCFVSVLSWTLIHNCRLPGPNLSIRCARVRPQLCVSSFENLMYTVAACWRTNPSKYRKYRGYGNTVGYLRRTAEWLDMIRVLLSDNLQPLLSVSTVGGCAQRQPVPAPISCVAWTGVSWSCARSVSAPIPPDNHTF